MAQTLGFVFAGASTVLGLAMLLLVVWQAPQHRHNRLMAIYLGTLVFWGANNVAARLSVMLGASPITYTYNNLLGNGLNAVALLWFVTDYVGIGRRPWVRTVRALAVVWLALAGIALYRGLLLADVAITPDGLWLYRLTPFAVPVFAPVHGIYLCAFGCLWVHRRGPAGALLPGGIMLMAGQLGTLLLLPFVDAIPPIKIAFIAAASVCFTYVILRENLFNPLARTEASLALLLEHTADPVWSVDAEGRLTAFNVAFQRLIAGLDGRVPERGRPVAELFPEEQRLLWQRFHERAQKGERVTVERHFDLPGVPERLEIRFSPIGAAGATPSGVAVFARDVTAHARTLAEQARAREAAEDASRAKSQFLASVSHELRTPLNAILGFAQVLAGSDGALTARQAELVGNVLTAGRYLLALINDLIDLSKIEAGKLDLAADRFKLREQLAAAVHLLGPAASRKRLELMLDVADAVPDGLVGDPRRLCQVLVNLVGNAVKFTERGHVLVRVEREAETYGGARLRFEVADTGIGITPSARARLFEPFVQDRDRASGGHDGVGLGLAISRRLVEAMGGQLAVESQPGHGSTFSFTLPFMCGPDAPAPAVELAGVSVLVLDDSETLRELLRRWLTRWRVRPTLVADADAARAALDRAHRAGTRFDLLLVDPDTKGAGALMTDAVVGVATVVMLPATAEVVGDGGSGERVVRIRKPFTPDQLRAALGVALTGTDGGAPARRRPRRTARPLRILVAEDSLTNLAIASTLLERWGHTVAQAGNGTQAVAAAHETPYDLIVMDLAMPGIDGLEATRRIRAAERGTSRRVPIVAMTASAMKGDRERCLEAGMDAYLAKPIDADELFEVVEGFAAPALGDGVERPERERFADALDAAAIVDRLDGDHAAVRTMARLFLMEYPRCLGDLRAALGTGDAAAVTRAAHALKGSIGLFGALGYDAARRLELIGQQGALAEAPGALRLLETELSRLLPMVNELADMDGGTYKEDSWRLR
jgi:PAS domain S-box-containing protein